MHRADLFVLRHGETEWNAARRMQGRLDSPLTPRGRDQARDQAAILQSLGIRADTHAFRCSPQGRAQATATIALAPFGVAPETDPRLMEIHMGDWEGLTLDEIAARAPHLFGEDDSRQWYDHIPGGERLSDVRDRAAAFLADLPPRPTVIVTHGILSAALRSLLLGLPADRIADMPGGQGIVWHMTGGRMLRCDARGLREDVTHVA